MSYFVNGLTVVEGAYFTINFRDFSSNLTIMIKVRSRFGVNGSV